MGKYYVTTPIYYVNDRPHIGHTLTTVLADIYTRYKKQQGNNVFFSTGTDEHGLKIKQAAQKAGKKPQEFVDGVAKDFKKAWKLLDVNYNCFVRTTDSAHKKLAQKFLQKLYDAGYIYKDTYEGLYCVGCEKFLTESDLNEDKKCPLHKPKQTIYQKEDNYFFKLSEFAPKVRDLIDADKFIITPPERKKEILARIDQGVDDISFSREKLDWGVPVPWDKEQTVYVWVEALLNYWTIPQMVNKKSIWPPDTQLVGKEILWFHAVIWPAMLLAAGEKLPQELFVHSFYLIDGKKMSKTFGNVITPKQLVDRYGVDGTRYLLAKSVPYSDDSDVGLTKFDEWYNADLANGLGNLVARVAVLAEKVKVKSVHANLQFYPEIVGHLQIYRFDLALVYIWEKIQQLDKLIDERKPWELDGEELSSSLRDIVNEIPRIAYNLQPFIPQTSEKILNQFSGKIAKEKALFPRLS